MELPIASAELVRTLRRPLSFVVAGGYYVALIVAALIGWISLEGRWADREVIGRGIFHAFLFLGYGLLSIHAVLIGANSLVGEREGQTSTLLRLAPIRHSSLVIQKLLTPLAMEWLFFIGSLPFLSLVFLLGGLSGVEFVYQLVNLFVWLNSCILLGLWVSSTAPSATRAGRNAVSAVPLLAWIGLFGGSLVEEVSRVLESARPDWTWDLQPLEEVFGWLESLSPTWMVRSWNDSSFFGSGPSAGSAVLIPALHSWCGHLLLQALLLWHAVRGWERTPEKPEVEGGRGGWLARLGLRRVRRGHHGPFPEGWRAYYEQEDREVFKGGRRAKRILVGAAAFIGVACSLFMLFWSRSPIPTIGEGFAQIAATVLSLVFILVCFGFAPNAFRRQIAAGNMSMVFLTPVPPWEVFLGKWLYYQALCFRFAGYFLLAFGPPFAVGLVQEDMIWRGSLSVFLSMGASLLIVPITSYLGVLAGLYSWTARTGAAVLFLFALCAMNCVACLAIPIGIVAAISILIAGPTGNTHYEEPRWVHDTRVCLACGFLGLFLFDAGALSFRPELRKTPFSSAFVPSLFTINLVVFTGILSFACWIWILGRPMEWWRRKLLTA